MQKSCILLFPICLLIVVAAAAPSQKHPARSRRNNMATGRSTEVARRINLGAAYMNQQEFQRALNLFRQAATLAYNLEIAKVHQGTALAYLQKYGPAQTVLSQVIRANPGNAH